MPRYLIETYVPHARVHQARAAGRRLRDAVNQLAAEQIPVRYVRTTYLPSDETCFHVLEAASVTVAQVVCCRAGLKSPRVTEVLETD